MGKYNYHPRFFLMAAMNLLSETHMAPEPPSRRLPPLFMAIMYHRGTMR